MLIYPAMTDHKSKPANISRTVFAEFANSKIIDAPVAAFDFDSTLRVHRGAGYDETLTARTLHYLTRSFNVVIISNTKHVDDIMAYVATVDGPVTVLASLAHDRYRKPHVGMWEIYTNWLSYPAAAGSFYCGDAAGRADDFAASDYNFVRNCNIAAGNYIDDGPPKFADGSLQFIVPEMLWGATKWRAFDADAVADLLDLTPKPKIVNVDDKSCEFVEFVAQLTAPSVVVLMGSQGSGKSAIAKMFGGVGYVVISRDVVGAEAKVIKTIKDAVSQSKNIVIDATHPTRAARAKMLTCVDDRYSTAIVHVATPKDMCSHLNAARCELGAPEVPIIALRTYWKNRELPATDEADHIATIPFAARVAAPRAVTTYRYT